VEQAGTKGSDVVIWSLHGSRFNRVLALLLKDRLGNRVQARYNDFIIRITRAGKEGAGDRIRSVLEGIRLLGTEEIWVVLPVPKAENWKFGRALPAPLLSRMALSDYYNIEEFMRVMGTVTITTPSTSSEADKFLTG
jgi:hypothetical protein